MLRLIALSSLLSGMMGSSLLADVPPEPKQAPPAPEFVDEPAPIPRPLPSKSGHKQAPLSSLGHLHSAVYHLREAGFSADADRIQRQADELREIRMTLLAEKRRQMDGLSTVISDLEKELGVESQYQLECRMCRISSGKLKQLGMAPPFQFPSNGQANTTILPHPQAFEESMHALMTKSLACQLAEPFLVVTTGRPASVHSGGEFPVIIPAGGATKRADFREFGVRMEAIVNAIGDQRVRIDLATEVSERDFKNAVKIEGTRIPGITSRSVKTQVEMNLGETMVMGGVVSGAGEDETEYVVALTASRVK
ncbi:type II and III secretion system protein family protein [Planctomicrobium piriforme]|uniref:Type II and III secretion system protein n=1 Tax=Planctomicrobium piriforme TaxID=1576369 RepID=A0A1I3CF42_9PLAN|nr:hypothetical protein [Planctomicrobium piriforme]SFH72966.1 type II and III secretion system protein [Planctomicrobium piriforme]